MNKPAARKSAAGEVKAYHTISRAVAISSVTSVKDRRKEKMRGSAYISQHKPDNDDEEVCREFRMIPTTTFPSPAAAVAVDEECGEKKKKKRSSADVKCTSEPFPQPKDWGRQIPNALRLQEGLQQLGGGARENK